MGTDYHIYIHDQNNLFKGKGATTPNLQKEQKETSPNISQVAGFVQSPVSSGINALGKATAFVAVAVATTKIIDQVVTIGGGFYEGYTGDNRFTLPYANFKKKLGYAMNPYSFVMDNEKQRMQYYRDNLQKEQLRVLAGMSVNNVVAGGKTL